MTEAGIREAREADAEALLEYVIALASEPGIPIVTTRERALAWTIESEAEYIRLHREQRNAVCLVALGGERIIGTLDMMGGDRAETEHCVTLGMSVAKDWRDRGIGRALMTRALEWARETDGVSRVELEVFPHNARAIHLYESMGFEHEGRRRRAFVKEGVALDALVMGILL
jgi:RimJ/RimL family protein N-acetyltransferase